MGKRIIKKEKKRIQSDSDSDSEDSWEVESILNEYYDKDEEKFYYLVSWSGYPESDNCWVINKLNKIIIFKIIRLFYIYNLYSITYKRVVIFLQL